MPIDWHDVFTIPSSEPPATAEELERLLNDLSRPLEPAEVIRIAAGQSHPFPAEDPLAPCWQPFDPSLWQMPGAGA